MATFVCRRTGRTYDVGEQLDHDGHAAVHAVDPVSSHLALKRYSPDTLQKRPELEARIKAMLAHQPAYRTGRSASLICAWPEDIAYLSGRFAGFVMPLVDTRHASTVHDLATSAETTWYDRVTVAENLARAVAELHDADVVVGDFRKRNLLAWSDRRVTLLGCDRMQVVDRESGRPFPCVADRDACTPPELLLASLSSTTLRTSSSDIFPLAVHLHLLLLHGAHPFRGEWRGRGNRPTEQELAQAGLWCQAGDPRIAPDPDAAPSTELPEMLQQYFRAAFVDGARNPEARPSAREWLAALTSLRESLDTATRGPASALPSGRDVAVETTGPVPPAIPDVGRPTRTRVMDSARPRRQRSALRLAVWVAAAVVGIGGVVGVASGTRRSAPAVADPAATAGTTSTAGPQLPATRSESPTDAIERIRVQDAPIVDTLAESWVAQLSTRPVGAPKADRTTTDAAILAGHEVLRKQYPGAVLLRSSDWNYDGESWITVMNQRFSTAEEANAWCDIKGFAGRDCFAKKLSRSGVVDGSARYRG